jgi:nucleotide-binding universal stress UspA family protein
MGKIIVPTDFSENAAKAFEYACELASNINKEITLLHAFQIPVMDTSIPTFMVQSMVEEEEKRCREELEKLCNKVQSKTYKKSGEALKCTYEIRQGFVVEEVLYEAEKEDADMIVMGTQGASGLKRIILGSNSAMVIEKSNIPVIAVPEGAVFTGFNKVVYATELQEGDLKVISKLAEIVSVFDSEITILHIGNPDDEHINAKMEQLRDEINSSVSYSKFKYEISKSEEADMGLNEYLDSHSVDLLAMVTHKRNLFEKLFSPSLTSKMAFHAKVPLLAYTS